MRDPLRDFGQRVSVRIGNFMRMLTVHRTILNVFFIFLLLMPIASSAQKNRSMVGSAAKAPDPASLKVVPDLAQRVAKFRSVQMTFQSTGLTANERRMIGKLVEACQLLESIFWRQNDPEALQLYQSLAGSKNERDILLRRYLWINESRFDLIDNNKPFVGKDPMPPGRGFYPQNLTREQGEKYVTDHPEK